MLLSRNLTWPLATALSLYSTDYFALRRGYACGITDVYRSGLFQLERSSGVTFLIVQEKVVQHRMLQELTLETVVLSVLYKSEI